MQSATTEGSEIEVILLRGDFNGDQICRIFIDLEEEDSDYDCRDEWMYFKAGAYTQNNANLEIFRGDLLAGGDTTGFGPGDREAGFDQVSFYRLDVSHDENDYSDCRDIN